MYVSMYVCCSAFGVKTASLSAGKPGITLSLSEIPKVECTQNVRSCSHISLYNRYVTCQASDLYSS